MLAAAIGVAVVAKKVRIRCSIVPGHHATHFITIQTARDAKAR